MKVRTVWTWGAPIVALLVVVACRSDSTPTPTGVSSLPPPESTPPEKFNCTNVEIVRARFSQPGYVEHNKVGLYVFFRGIPEGAKRLRIWWNYLDRRDVFRDVRIESGEESFEDVLEHVYEGLTEPTTFVVRAEVIVDGLRGHCARNREVDVRPPPPSVQTAFVGPTDNTFSRVSATSSYINGLKFTVFRTMTLQSVKVYPLGTGTLVVLIEELIDGGSNIEVGSSSTMITESGEQRVPVGIMLLPGDYGISLTGTMLQAGVEHNPAGALFPYTLPGVMSITSDLFDSVFYDFFYDWEVSWQ